MNRTRARLAVCPDCDADYRLDPDPHGVLHVTVLHDPTCAWLNDTQDVHPPRNPRKEHP